MSLDRAKAHLEQFGLADRIINRLGKEQAS